MTDLPGELARLQHYAMGMQRLMDELQQASRQPSEGTDRSRVVRSAYGPDGLPETIRVSPYWRERLRPDGFAAAVAEACQAAVTQRGTLWSQALARTGWRDRVDRLEEDSAQAAVAAGPAGLPAASGRGGNGAPPMPPGALAEAVMSLADSVSATAASPQPQPASVTAANRDRTLSLTLTPAGEVSCRADPRWVSQRTGAQLSEQLSGVLASARQALAATREAPACGRAAAHAAEADDLVAEGLAALRAARQTRSRAATSREN